MRKLKRFVSTVIALTMVMSMIVMPQMAYAAGTPLGEYDKSTESSDKRADLYYEYLGTTPADLDMYDEDEDEDISYTGALSGLNKNSFTWEEGGLVWIGIKVKNMSRLRTMMNSAVKVTDAAGVASLALAIAYDTDYFELPTSGKNKATAQTDRILNNVTYFTNKAENKMYNFSDEGPNTYSELKNASHAASIRALGMDQSDYSKINILKLKLGEATSNVTGDRLLFMDGAKMYGGNGGTGNSNLSGFPVTDDETLLYLIPLKMKATAPSNASKKVEGYFDKLNSAMTVGTSGAEYITYDYEDDPNKAGDDGNTNLRNRFNITSKITFPISVTQTGVQVKADTTPTLTFIEGKKIEDAPAEIQQVFDSGDPEDVDAGDVTYYYSTTDKGANSFAAEDLASDFTAVNLNNGIPKLTGTNYLYASDGNFAIKLGQLTVNAATVATITSASATPGTVYSGDAVSFADGKFSVSGTLTNGKTFTCTTAEALASNGLAFYTKSGDTWSNANTLGNYSAVTTAGAATTTDTFYVANADKSKSKDFTVTVNYNKTNIESASTNPVLKYNAGDKFDPTGIAVKAWTDKSGSGTKTTVNYANFGDNNLKVVIIPKNYSAAQAAEAAAADANTEITNAMVTSSGATQYGIFVVAPNNGGSTAKTALVGLITKKAADDTSITENLSDTEYTYPETIDLSGLKFKIVNTDDSSRNYEKSIADALTDGKIDAVDIVKGETTIAHTAPLTYAQNGQVTLNFKKDGTVLASKTVTLTVARKKLTLDFSDVSIADRDYSGKTVTTVGAVTGTAKISAGVESEDTAPTIPTINYSFADGNVAYESDGTTVAAKAVSAAFAANATTTDNKYELTIPTTTGVTGKIQPLALNVTAIDGIVISQVNDATEDAEVEAETDSFTSNKISGDDVKITYTGKIDVADVKNGTATNAATVNDADFTITNGTDKGNYKKGTISGIKGTVTNLPVAEELLNIPTVADIKASENLDLDGLKAKLAMNNAKVKADDGKEYPVTVEWETDDTIDPKGGTYTFKAKITPADPTKVIATIRPTVTITVTPVTITKPTVDNISVQMNAQNVKLSEGGNTVTVPATDAVPYTIAWTTEDGTPVTDVNINTSTSGTTKYKGTISYTNAPNWLTKPTKEDGSEDNEVECTVTVADRTLASIAVDTTDAKLTYTYPDLTPDFSGVKVTATYDNGDEAEVTNVTYSVTGTLPYGDTEVTVTYEEAGVSKTATFTVTANKKTIKLTDLMFTVTKKAGVDEVKVEVEVNDSVIEDGDDITITAEGVFDDDIAGENKPVHIKNIALSGDAADNYTLEATEGSGTGTIEPGTQNAPDKVEVTVDNKTNNITVTYPTGANVEYSIDGGTTWVKDTTFTGLTKGTEYTVQARYAATATTEASDAAETKVTTYKYHVTRTKKGSKKIYDEIYTSVDTAQTVNDINKVIFTKAPSSFAAYYTDATCKEKVVYPYTMQAETELYYTVSGGGGGGGIPSFAVVFSAGAHGKIVSGKASLNITSGEVIKELPVVEANEGYKFVGWSQDGGKTIINLADNPIKKASTFTAVYEEDVKPTPTPGIPAVYTKPYASGYDGDIFLPENNITRAELATMIARLIYGDELPEGMYRASFSDIPSDAWYSKYVGYLENYGILDGYDEDGILVFKPEQTITRAEMATVITRAQKFAIDYSENTFWDVENDYWAKDYITTLAAKNIITGYADGSFAPTNPLTRAEAVVIINRLLDPSTAIVTFNPIDISGHWAENEIILAVNERKVNGTGEEATPEPEETPAPEADETAEPTEAPAE